MPSQGSEHGAGVTRGSRARLWGRCYICNTNRSNWKETKWWEDFHGLRKGCTLLPTLSNGSKSLQGCACWSSSAAVVGGVVSCLRILQHPDRCFLHYQGSTDRDTRITAHMLVFGTCCCHPVWLVRCRSTLNGAWLLWRRVGLCTLIP